MDGKPVSQAVATLSLVVAVQRHQFAQGLGPTQLLT